MLFVSIYITHCTLAPEVSLLQKHAWKFVCIHRGYSIFTDKENNKFI